MSDNLCPICSAPNMTTFFRLDRMPVFCNLLWPDIHHAKTCPRGDIHLAFCKCCGFITNVRFDESLIRYSQHYNNSLFFSSVFKDYAENSAADLIQRFELYDKTIIEIGSGQGEFLQLLCHMGPNKGIGFDPAFSGAQKAGEWNNGVLFIQDNYSKKYSHYQADLFCCRHVLEHIQYPRQLLADIKTSISDHGHTALYLQVPNSIYTLSRPAVWDIIYEHCSYFTPSSLHQTIAGSGFTIDALNEEFNDQYLSVFAVSTNGRVQEKKAAQYPQLPDPVLSAFQINVNKLVNEWNVKLQSLHSEGRRIVMWGAGSKGVSFLNMVDMGSFISNVVDINPKKQAHFIPGTGHQIISPRELIRVDPDIVIVANPIYMDEVRNILNDLGLDARVMSL